jgi:hypothetical protein
MNRKLHTLLCVLKLLFFTNLICAQNFSLVSTNIESTTSSSIAHSDVDNDGDIDVIASGYETNNEPKTRLYLNDSNGNFTVDTNTIFHGISDGDILFFDADNDGDEDVLISGLNDNLDGETRLYLNDGSGVFIEDVAVPFVDVYGGEVDSADYDNDGDIDIIITGFNDITATLHAELYQNNGSGIFTEVAVTPFEGSWDGSVRFLDYDNDNDQDLIISGRDNAFANSVILYENNNGTYTKVLNTPFLGVIFSAIDIADIDGDNDLDILISGQGGSPSYAPITALYLNYGNGLFIEDNTNPFIDVDFGSHAFSDIDLDGDQDVIISGFERNGTAFVPNTKLYLNDGTGDFAQIDSEPFVGVGTSAVDFFDADGDGVNDVLIAGDLNSGSHSSNLYINTNTLSLQDYSATEKVMLYPNPVNQTEILNIQLPQSFLNRAYTLSIYNVNGRLLYNEKRLLQQNVNQSLALNGVLQSGVYFIEITSDNQYKDILKLIVN